jgi:hypothetical protein
LALAFFEFVAYFYGQREQTLSQRRQNAEAEFLRAQTGEGLAFDEVLKLSTDASQPPEIRATAQRIIAEVTDRYFRQDLNDWGNMNRGGVTTSEMRRALKSDDPRERWNALGSLRQRIAEVAYRNARPAGSPPTWEWPEKATRELAPLYPLLNDVFEIMTSDRDLKLRMAAGRVFTQFAGANRPTSPGFRLDQTVTAKIWWSEHKAEYSGALIPLHKRGNECMTCVAFNGPNSSAAKCGMEAGANGIIKSRTTYLTVMGAQLVRPGLSS